MSLSSDCGLDGSCSFRRSALKRLKREHDVGLGRIVRVVADTVVQSGDESSEGRLVESRTAVAATNGLISHRFKFALRGIKKLAIDPMPSRKFGNLVLTTSLEVLDLEEDESVCKLCHARVVRCGPQFTKSFSLFCGGCLESSCPEQQGNEGGIAQPVHITAHRNEMEAYPIDKHGDIDFLGSGLDHSGNEVLFSSDGVEEDDIKFVCEVLRPATSKPVLVHVVGLPGAGKTTVLKAARARLECIEELAFCKHTKVGFKYSRSGCVVVLGSWQGHAMDGMDKTSLAGSHDAKNFVGVATNLGVRLVLCEGYRLMQKPFMEAVMRSTSPVLLRLDTSFSVARRRYENREIERNANVMPLDKYHRAACRLEKWAAMYGYESVTAEDAIERICGLLCLKQEPPTSPEVKEEVKAEKDDEDLVVAPLHYSDCKSCSDALKHEEIENLALVAPRPAGDPNEAAGEDGYQIAVSPATECDEMKDYPAEEPVSETISDSCRHFLQGSFLYVGDLVPGSLSGGFVEGDHHEGTHIDFACHEPLQGPPVHGDACGSFNTSPAHHGKYLSGDLCGFSDTLVGHPGTLRDVGVCKYFTEGRCERGNDCRFEHPGQPHVISNIRGPDWICRNFLQVTFGIDEPVSPDGLDFVLAFVDSLSILWANIILKTWSNAWTTSSHANDEPEKLDCLFGCAECADELAHYLCCWRLWRLLGDSPHVYFSIPEKLLLQDPTYDRAFKLVVAFLLYHALKKDPGNHYADFATLQSLLQAAREQAMSSSPIGDLELGGLQC